MTCFSCGLLSQFLILIFFFLFVFPFWEVNIKLLQLAGVLRHLRESFYAQPDRVLRVGGIGGRRSCGVTDGLQSQDL
ncbi:hypothetical protein BDV36DRAFT_18487 [Aspergillus pseudocaelatus]|uniref:Secreted protein n=1 Tax=Aspergillus pseudocaelatus TaxID=1825620 RepID=A0ABQ6X1F7_9EURO|nr:hypothetical protein BDV36DRAFT_18487 [Aspergillus pseudocaelatus]